ncbi:quorum sensing histidine kinase QseC [Crenobacter sp. SG2305]|uniref:quorum sensing histidine kinase QseC n=1 Tax=Crenobacter oryzisoli TaxID=3056844 RepID=UPI0025AAE04E|nr:quorum sensing histidine kinase QseC [Crenobacter sp. SG2305]MDN0082081.1 quorum sensing histidine kinase QseC [Crenobacter sp. SG2305]
MKVRSLRLRLSLILLVVAPLVWALATVGAYFQTRHEVNQLFDTQQTLFARQLLSSNLATRVDELPELPKTKRLIRGGEHGGFDDDALSFAVFDAAGRLLFYGGDGKHFPADPARRGFVVATVKHQGPWRLFYLPAPDGQRIVAVGQKEGYRRELVWEVVGVQLAPWLAALPLLLLVLVWAIGRELAPLRATAHELAVRRADDASPLQVARLASEVAPMVSALNQLFARTADTLARERRFTADAAHELRSPLAALKVQAEVAQLAEHDPAARQRALGNLTVGIDRATRLVEQLLALSRLDPLSGLADAKPVRWQRVADAACADVAPLAAQRQVTVERVGDASAALPLPGDETLLTLLLRNLLDNALRYGPPGGRVVLTLAPDAIHVDDNGPGIAPDDLPRVRERFFRPPGQSEPGSGLGLSIVERIASLHGLTLLLANRPGGGFVASLVRG